jgi:hypothetical protein
VRWRVLEFGDDLADGVRITSGRQASSQRLPARLAAERRHPLRRLVDHAPHCLYLRVQHRMDRDEVRPDNVPVNVLERQREVVQ